MEYKLTIVQNAIDSLNESLSKFEQGQNGDIKAHKFAILHMAHFVELTLKYSVQKYTPHLVYSDVYRNLNKSKFKTEHGIDNLNIVEAYEKLASNGYEFNKLLKNSRPHTITVSDAVEINKCHKCTKTGVLFLDSELEDCIDSIKDLRNDIEHFDFSFNPKEVRLKLGYLIREITPFIDCMDLYDMDLALNEDRQEVFETLSDEYEQNLKEAQILLKGKIDKHSELCRGVSPKDRMIDSHLYEFTSYDCPECNQKGMLVQDDESDSGFRCVFCENEDSLEIEYKCDRCESWTPQFFLSTVGEMTVCENCHPENWMGD
ncbi:hypothetical protein [Endozoicomonas sp. SCSIO W0465]|uniref:hypothetical protein n=1 Tax=Endozoicomonas sp. SCSIO W0465 TaxID=2918516 RepID=UPI002075A0F3|nr:hypothetical protein [Endozoicomonas sp. SCSIO W0465]USE39532.1 hypothetical protein MJO57_16020 [Endozoicomonas sp. SCSIO W0465]